ncbi:hypothetical protein C5L28_001251 [Lentilactobacillus parakefiri]|uniref:Membrane protein n=1 Tax=Lentilactobacillus parakefiri TaxID=152332 RepID=A0A224VH79_9LACO|nr:hypothetical protein C5L28_001251 [Lentilactobacillus parakefiri]GAW71912.1 membrane protein [Lentilactobacillus parakefiri]
MTNKRRTVVVGQILLVAALIAVFLGLTTLLKTKHFLLFSFMILLCTILPAYWRFERTPLKTQTLMFLAILIALAVAGRVPFASIPSVQAASFVIILGGISLGPELGFVVGSATALVSNMFLGQGPWTPWQMFAWGLMGVVRRPDRLHQITSPAVVYDLVWRCVGICLRLDHGLMVCLSVRPSTDSQVFYPRVCRQL